MNKDEAARVPMDLKATPLNPIPYGVTLADVPGDGPAIRCAIWPGEDAAIGTVVLFVGRSEYIERYFETIADLRRRGYAVVIFDWRGQGGSERLLPDPRKGHIATFRAYDDDGLRVLNGLVYDKLPRPYIGFGHSMGGHILLRLARRPDCQLSRVVLSAPMMEIHPTRLGVPERIGYSFAQTMRGMGLGARYVPGGSAVSFESLEFEDNPLTHDRTRFDRNREIATIAPDLGVGDPTIAWLGAAIASMRELQRPEMARRILIPTLCCVAENDRIVATRAAERFCDNLPVARCMTMVRAEHELLQETDAIRSQFWSAFDAFCQQDAIAA
ncbi:MAG: alpha/beta hydrolase [Pseudomonadota bacterium]